MFLFNHTRKRESRDPLCHRYLEIQHITWIGACESLCLAIIRHMRKLEPKQIEPLCSKEWHHALYECLRPVKLWPSLMKSPTYFHSLPPDSPPLSTTAPFIPWSCWLSLCQGKERHCFTARIRKNFSSFHKPYVLKVSHPYCLWQASASRIQCHNNCTSPNLLDYIHRSAPNWPAPNYATVHKLRV